MLFGELAALYQAFTAGQPAPLAELPIQYADFAAWQRLRLQGELVQTQFEYWQKRLQDVPVLQLPTDRPRPPLPGYQAGTVPLQLSRELSAALRKLSVEAGVTEFMTLQAAFAAVMGAWSGQTDIVVGFPEAGRHRQELEGLIGCFVNSLILRTDLSADPTFKELLGRVKEEALGAYAHAELPFEFLVEKLQPQRDPSRNPIFQVMFALQNAPIGRPQLAGLEVATERVPPTTRFDQEWHLYPGSEGVRGELVYALDLFEQATVEGMVESYLSLLTAAVADRIGGCRSCRSWSCGPAGEAAGGVE